MLACLGVHALPTVAAAFRFLVSRKFFHEVSRDFFQETARRVALRLAVDHARLAVGEIERFFGARDADVAEAALFFHGRVLREAAAQDGEDAVIHACQENNGEFEAFGAVERHHRQAVRILVVFVRLGDERFFFQKFRQRPFRMFL